MMGILLKNEEPWTAMHIHLQLRTNNYAIVVINGIQTMSDGLSKSLGSGWSIVYCSNKLPWISSETLELRTVNPTNSTLRAEILSIS